jgi:hypothetical protein
MDPVEWPERKCREVIYKGDQPYTCEVVDLHPGPCASFSHRETVERRDKWEAEHPNWKREMKEAGGAFE